MEPDRAEQLAHLQQLADELTRRGFTAQLVSTGRLPCVQATNPGTTKLTERVVCQKDNDGAWSFWWPWKQPIGSCTDLVSAAVKIMTVLRSIEGAT